MSIMLFEDFEICSNCSMSLVCLVFHDKNPDMRFVIYGKGAVTKQIHCGEKSTQFELPLWCPTGNKLRQARDGLLKAETADDKL